MGVFFLCLGGEVRSGGGQCEEAKQVGEADGAMGEVDDDPKMGGEVAMEGAVVLEAMDDGRERLLRGRDNAGFVEEVAQVRDLVWVASRYVLELQRLQHG